MANWSLHYLADADKPLSSVLYNPRAQRYGTGNGVRKGFIKICWPNIPDLRLYDQLLITCRPGICEYSDYIAGFNHLFEINITISR